VLTHALMMVVSCELRNAERSPEIARPRLNLLFTFVYAQLSSSLSFLLQFISVNLLTVESNVYYSVCYILVAQCITVSIAMAHACLAPCHPSLN